MCQYEPNSAPSHSVGNHLERSISFFLFIRHRLNPEENKGEGKGGRWRRSGQVQALLHLTTRQSREVGFPERSLLKFEVVGAVKSIS